MINSTSKAVNSTVEPSWDRVPEPGANPDADPKLALLNEALINGTFDRLKSGKVWKPQGPVTDKFGTREPYVAMVQEWRGVLAITMQSGARPHERRFLVDGYGDFYMEDDKQQKAIPIKPLDAPEWRNKYHETIKQIVAARLNFVRTGELLVIAEQTDGEAPPEPMELVWKGPGKGYDYEPLDPARNYPPGYHA